MYRKRILARCSLLLPSAITGILYGLMFKPISAMHEKINISKFRIHLYKKVYVILK